MGEERFEVGIGEVPPSSVLIRSVCLFARAEAHLVQAVDQLADPALIHILLRLFGGGVK